MLCCSWASKTNLDGIELMCGRYNLIASKAEIMAHFSVPCLPDYQPDYNIPPGQDVLAVISLEDGSHKAVNLHWGLIPSWAKDKKIASRTFNARAETITEKPSFRSAYQHRRCLIPATGFFEWHQTETRKQPYHIHRADHGLFAFAGLWEHWQHEQVSVYSCTLMTMAAQGKMARIHERMPVIISPDYYQHWLDHSDETADVAHCLATAIISDMQLTAVSALINNPMHNGPDCLWAVE